MNDAISTRIHEIIFKQIIKKKITICIFSYDICTNLNLSNNTEASLLLQICLLK